MINVHKSKKKYGRSFFISKFKIIKESFDGFTYSTGNKKDVGVLSYRNMTYFGPT